MNCEENAMVNLSRDDLWSLEEYAVERPGFRARVMEHKKTRQVGLGEHARLYFEDALTIKYQIQEMLRIERVFEAEGIMEELEAYNPLIPDGSNWKATFMIEYADPAERGLRLAEMIGIEDKVWLQVEGCDKVFAIADEDLDRETADKTSSVHFMRYELDASMVAAVKGGANIFAGIDHPAYPIEAVQLSAPVRDSLANDLEEVSLN
jgi:hypothetical protein